MAVLKKQLCQIKKIKKNFQLETVFYGQKRQEKHKKKFLLANNLKQP